MFKLASLMPTAGAAQEMSPSEKPNIVYILTDDLDTYTLNQMETTCSLLADQGMTFKNATFSTSLCCHSRTTCSGASTRTTRVSRQTTLPTVASRRSMLLDATSPRTPPGWAA